VFIFYKLQLVTGLRTVDRLSAISAVFTNRDISLIRRGRLYSSCVRSSMLHGSETWCVRKENEVALQRAEIKLKR